MELSRKPDSFLRIPRHLSLAHRPRSIADVAAVTLKLVEVALDFAGGIEYISIYEPGMVAESGFALLVDLFKRPADKSDSKQNIMVELALTTTSYGLVAPQAVKVMIPVPKRHHSRGMKTLRIHYACEQSSGKQMAAGRLALLAPGAELLWKQSSGGQWHQSAQMESKSGSVVDPGVVFSPNTDFPDPDLIILCPEPPKTFSDLFWNKCATRPMQLAGYPAWWLRIAEIVQVSNERCVAGLLLGHLFGRWAGGAPEAAWIQSMSGWLSEETIWHALRSFDGREKREGK
jgi:hypothetical protein